MSLYDMLDNLVTVLFDLAFACTPFLLVNWILYVSDRRRGRARPYPILTVVFFTVPILTIFALSSILKDEAAKQITAYFNGLGKAEVFIDGKPVPAPEAVEVIQAIQIDAHIMAHHSHPTRRIEIRVVSEGKGTLTLVLGRDVDVSQEYWLFYPRYRTTSSNEVYRVHTGVLDKY